MKIIQTTTFRLYSEDRDFCKESKRIDPLIREVKKIAEDAELNLDPGFVYRIVAVTVEEQPTSDFERLNGLGLTKFVERKTEIAELDYSNGELIIDFYF